MRRLRHYVYVDWINIIALSIDRTGRFHRLIDRSMSKRESSAEAQYLSKQQQPQKNLQIKKINLSARV